MGLDMYLTARIYLSEHNEKEKEIAKKIKKYFPNVDFNVQEVRFEVFYWRKANAIHKWFVDNVQDGKDDCGTYYVSWDQLQGLLNAINKVFGVTDKEKVVTRLSGEYNTEHLPTQGGFFFGNTEYDKYYIEGLKDTKKMLEKLFDNKEEYKDLDFYYSSSW